MQPVARSLAGDAGLGELNVNISRPTHEGVFIPRLDVTSGEFPVTAVDVHVAWSLASLRASRIDSLKGAELMIQQNPSAAPP